MKLTRCSALEGPPPPPPTLDEIDVTRHREITSKAVSAILLLTLKWFKVSRSYLCNTCMTCVLILLFDRCYEVPPFGTIIARYKLSFTYLEDVWPAGSDLNHCVES